MRKFVFLLMVAFSQTGFAAGVWSESFNVDYNFFEGAGNGVSIAVKSDRPIVKVQLKDKSCENTQWGQLKLSNLGEVAFNLYSGVILSSIVSGHEIQVKFYDNDPCDGARLKVVGVRVMGE